VEPVYAQSHRATGELVMNVNCLKADKVSLIFFNDYEYYSPTCLVQFCTFLPLSLNACFVPNHTNSS
jgi:hypothetical protein